MKKILIITHSDVIDIVYNKIYDFLLSLIISYKN